MFRVADNHRSGGARIRVAPTDYAAKTTKEHKTFTIIQNCNNLKF